MKNKNEHLQMLKMILIILLITTITALMGLISSCAQSKQSPNPTRSASEDQISTSIHNASTTTFTAEPSVTATIHTTTDFREWSLLPAPTIGVTQIPPIVNPPTGENDVFLYKDVIVTIKFDLSIGMDAWGEEYLNLDDLKNNGLTNSDVLFSATVGTTVTYGIGPANNAMNYPAQTEMDFESCMAHLQDCGGYTLPDSNLPYCFLTDEGRIAIVQYVPDSIRYESGIAIMSYRITVYKQKVSR